jgi:uncharacterized membrane protein YfcA
MMGASIAGGYVGPMVARKVSPDSIRTLVIVVGVIMTSYFFWKSAHLT